MPNVCQPLCVVLTHWQDSSNMLLRRYEPALLILYNKIMASNIGAKKCVAQMCFTVLYATLKVAGVAQRLARSLLVPVIIGFISLLAFFF